MISFSKSKSMISAACIVSLFSICLYSSVVCSAENKSGTEVEDNIKEKNIFSYNPVGLRDPFAPLVQEMRKTIAKPKRNLGPLEKFQLQQFRLMAMLIVQGTPRAMVKAPDGNSYTVKVGDLIGSNSGIVKKIETKTVAIDKATGQRIEKSPDRVVVEETGVDSFTGKVVKEERYIEM